MIRAGDKEGGGGGKGIQGDTLECSECGRRKMEDGNRVDRGRGHKLNTLINRLLHRPTRLTDIYIHTYLSNARTNYLVYVSLWNRAVKAIPTSILYFYIS